MARYGEKDKRILAKLGGSILGHAWDAPTDVINFVLTVDVASKKDKTKGSNKFINKENLEELKKITITKRLVLSMVSSWYDPLGLLCPITIKYKIQLSEVVKMKELGWDDDVGEELSEHWRELFEEIINLPEFKFHRSTKPENAVGPPEMVIFWDGAMPSYAASIYLRWRITSQNKPCHPHLATSGGSPQNDGFRATHARVGLP